MGLWSGIKSIGSAIIGSDKITTGVVDLAKDISSGIDLIVETDEEKTQYKQQAVDQWLKLVEMLKGSEQQRSITRRILAIGTFFNVACLAWLCVWFEVYNAFTQSLKVGASGLTTVTEAVLKISATFQVGWAFVTIIIFYFGPHLINHFKGPKT